MIIGTRVKDARMELGITQEQLGDKVGVSKVSICGYEQGTRMPSISILPNLADALNVSVDYLLGRDVDVVSEDKKLSVKMRKEDMRIIKEIKKNDDLYHSLLEDTPRTIKLINKKLYN